MEGELDPPYYTPIFKSVFIVTKSEGIKVTIEDIPLVTKGGRSLPVLVELGAAPHNSLNVYYSILEEPDGVKFDKEYLHFEEGSSREYFTILANETAQEGNYTLIL